MSDLFDAFDSNETVAAVATGSDNLFDASDPAAEFLAREQAELAKIENEAVDFGQLNAESNVAFDDFGGTAKSAGFGDENVDPFYSASGANENQDPYSLISKVDKLQQEPEKIKRWREEQKLRLTTKDAEEEVKKKDWKEVAKKELDDWYKNRQEQLTKTHANNKVNNKAAEAELLASRDQQGGTEWERVTKLCDFNPKANKNNKDVGRMRSILLQLKQTPLNRP